MAAGGTRRDQAVHPDWLSSRGFVQAALHKRRPLVEHGLEPRSPTRRGHKRCGGDTG